MNTLPLSNYIISIIERYNMNEKNKLMKLFIKKLKYIDPNFSNILYNFPEDKPINYMSHNKMNKQITKLCIDPKKLTTEQLKLILKKL
jgi:hypothetical protein